MNDIGRFFAEQAGCAVKGIDSARSTSRTWNHFFSFGVTFQCCQKTQHGKSVATDLRIFINDRSYYKGPGIVRWGAKWEKERGK